MGVIGHDAIGLHPFGEFQVGLLTTNQQVYCVLVPLGKQVDAAVRVEKYCMKIYAAADCGNAKFSGLEVVDPSMLIKSLNGGYLSIPQLAERFERVFLCSSPIILRRKIESTRCT
jgi:hypothetical protein